MIYSNVNTEVKSKDLGCGVKYYLAIEDTHRPVSLWTTENLALQKGMNHKITAGMNYRRRPCLVEEEDYHLFLFLYAATDKLGTKRGEIKIHKNHADNVRVVSYFGQNKCLLAEVIDPLVGALIQVRPYGLPEDVIGDLYVIHECNVYHCTSDTLEACCKEHNIECPAEFDARGCALVAAPDWVTM